MKCVICGKEFDPTEAARYTEDQIQINYEGLYPKYDVCGICAVREMKPEKERLEQAVKELGYVGE